MVKNKKKYPQNELFEKELNSSDRELLYHISEADVKFPLFFKSKNGTQYTMYQNEEKYEMISINKANESFSGCILFGFNERVKILNGDLRAWIFVHFRNQIKIEAEEYERVFEKVINSRQEFFTTDNYKYIEKVVEWGNQKPKHKWKPL